MALENCFVKTLNNMGYMTKSLDATSLDFVQFAGGKTGPQLPVMDVGSAFGVASLPCVKNHHHLQVWVNDLDGAHLDAMEEELNAGERERLRKIPGDFLTLALPKDCLRAIIVSRVLHFLEPAAVQRAFQLFAQWLAPGGRLYVTAETPYVSNFRAFHPIYSQRLQNGDEWPGLVRNVQEIDPYRGAALPSFFHFLNPSILRREAERAGLQVLESDFFGRPEFPADIQMDGRESAFLICVHP